MPTSDSTSLVLPAPTATNDSALSVSTLQPPTVGVPLPYNPRTDDLVTGALMVSTFAILLLVVKSWGFIVRIAGAFFYNLLPRRAVPTDGADLEEAGDNRLMHLHISFMLGLAFLCYTTKVYSQDYLGKQPYTLLFTAVALVTVWYVVRGLLYRFIDSVFFEHWQHILWSNVRTQCTFLTNLILLPLLLIHIYFSPPTIWFVASVLFVIVVSRLVLLVRCYSTFFTYRGGFIHLFLYFCTLEVAPMLALWRLLEEIP